MSHKRQSQPPSRAKGRTRGHRAEAKMSRRQFVRNLGGAAIAAGAAAEGSRSSLPTGGLVNSIGWSSPAAWQQRSSTTASVRDMPARTIVPDCK